MSIKPVQACSLEELSSCLSAISADDTQKIRAVANRVLTVFNDSTLEKAKSILDRLEGITSGHQIDRQTQEVILKVSLALWQRYPNVRGKKEEDAERIFKAFQGNLYKLNLFNSEFRSLPPCIKYLTALTVLDLSNNKLAAIPPEIGNLTHLTKLYLSNNRLSTIPPEIGNLRVLIKLDLSNNRLSTIPPEIGNLRVLIKLDLNNNKLAAIPIEIGNLTALTELYLIFNKLAAIPPEIGNLTALIVLNLNNNKLAAIPPEIGNLSALRELNLSHNKLAAIPPEIGYLWALIMLDLSGNKLVSIPADIGSLFSLKVFYIYKNKNLRDLPLSLGQIPEITEIDISDTLVSRTLAGTIIRMSMIQRNFKAIYVLPTRVNAWKMVGKSTLDLLGIEEFSKFERQILNEWLMRFEKTCDYKTQSQRTLAKTVCQMLYDLTSNEKFKEHFFEQISEDFEHWEERAAMSFNGIFMLWKIYTLDAKATTKEKVEILASAVKTDLFRRVLSRLIPNGAKESVEIYLYYEIALKERLNLLTSSNGMLHSQLGARDYDQDAIIREVEGRYLDELIEHKIFDTLANQETEIQEIQLHFAEQMDVLDKASFVRDQERIDAMDQLKAQRQSVLLNAKKAWAKKILGVHEKL